MFVAFSSGAWEDYLYFQDNSKQILRKINCLIRDIIRDPEGKMGGLGKVERLHNNLSGFYSRRIDKEHRIVYDYDKDYLRIMKCRFHYE